jgi:hypothetical protein
VTELVAFIVAEHRASLRGERREGRPRPFPNLNARHRRRPFKNYLTRREPRYIVLPPRNRSPLRPAQGPFLPGEPPGRHSVVVQVCRTSGALHILKPRR